MATAKTIFEWDLNKYTTKVAAMDREHQGLIEIMNELYLLNEAGGSKAQLLTLADKLGKKTTEHFAHEEQYLSTLKNYTGLAPHKVIHATLLENFKKHVEAFKKDSGQKLPLEFFNFLKVWLTAHICGIDRKYGEIASQK